MASEEEILSAAKKGDVALQEILKNSANNIDVKDILGEQISGSTLKFLLLLVDRNRIGVLENI